jgi:hypothetical protein
MTESTTDKPKQLTLGKLLLIVGLVKALIIVLFLQFRSNDIAQAFNAHSASSGANTRRTRRKPAAPNKPDSLPTHRTTTWPSIGLEQAAAFDPFAVPEQIIAKATPQTASPSTQLVQSEPPTEPAGPAPAPPNPFESAAAQRLRSQGVSAIIARGGERIALIGNEEIRVGDRLGDFRVTAIGDTGVELAVDPLDELPNTADTDTEFSTPDQPTRPTATKANE